MYDRRRRAWTVVVLFGLVSLLADMTYEGARSLIGPYLGLLGAGAAVVAAVAGLGEWLAHGLRLLSGYWSDRTRAYWTFVFVGYGVNLLSVPLLALARSWPVAAGLVVLERIGKALRTPARDALLSQATEHVGHGRGFGLHEALDQIGAVLGPALMAVVVWKTGAMRPAFAVLLLPALAALGMLVLARHRHPAAPTGAAPPGFRQGVQRMPRAFWIYLAAAGLLAAGFVDFPFIAYVQTRTGGMPVAWVPLLYILAMAVDAAAALLFGRLFDRLGMRALPLALLPALPAPALVLLPLPRAAALVGVTLWGLGMGVQESVLRAGVASMVPQSHRGTAYGLFNTGYGLAWFLGSLVVGGLWTRWPWAAVVAAFSFQVAGLAGFWFQARQG